jgi:collagenase-like PrtC family protease
MEEDLQHLLRVEGGNPSAEEIAAVVAVLTAAVAESNAAAAKTIRQPRSTWNRSATILRNTVTPGFGQWTASTRPGLD